MKEGRKRNVRSKEGKSEREKKMKKKMSRRINRSSCTWYATPHTNYQVSFQVPESLVIPLIIRHFDIILNTTTRILMVTKKIWAVRSRKLSKIMFASWVIQAVPSGLSRDIFYLACTYHTVHHTTYQIIHTTTPTTLPTILLIKHQTINHTEYNLTPLEPESRFGDKPLKFQVVCPQNGTAVLKGLNTSCIKHT